MLGCASFSSKATLNVQPNAQATRAWWGKREISNLKFQISDGRRGEEKSTSKAPPLRCAQRWATLRGPPSRQKPDHPHLKTETVRCKLPAAWEVKTEILAHYFVSAVSWLLAMSFAAVWGAHLYQTTVLFPAWVSDVPRSLVEWLATPYAKRVPRFFQWLVSVLYTFASIAVVVAVVTGLRMRLGLGIAGVCGFIHLTLNLLIFLPTNLKLGFDPGGPGASSLDPQMVKMLVRRWGRWNFVRFGVETAGLIAALFAVKAS